MYLSILFLLYLTQLASTLQLILPSKIGEASIDNSLYLTSSDHAICPVKDGDSNLLLSSQWSVLGPFPAGMREHQLGAFPALTLHPLSELFNLADPIAIPSTYGKAGLVKVKSFESQSHAEEYGKASSRVLHSLRISYPDLDWKMVQQSVGWAGIQWQALSVTDMHIKTKSKAIVSVTLASAAEFAVLSEEEFLSYKWDNCSSHVKWYNGDWYSYTSDNMADGSEMPGHTLQLEPGYYKVLVKSVYEVRIFGGMKGDVPVVEYDLDVRIREATGSHELLAITTGQFVVVPDVVDGVMAGWGISFALRNYGQQSIEVQKVKIVGEAKEYLASESSNLPLHLASLQLRPVKLRVASIEALPASITALKVQVSFQVANETRYLTVNLPLKHVKLFSSEDIVEEPIPFQFTFLDSDQTVQYAIATPPRNIKGVTATDQRPAILHLHGAGVDVRLDEAQRSLSSQNDSWIIEPSGRSPWGYDWQIASHLSARTALQEFSHHMYGLSDDVKSKAAKIDKNKVMITGHSNGGQGVYHYASHRPDKVIGAIVGAGYISLADYVPLTWQLGRYFNDATLNGVLRSSLNAFENGLFASNLAGLPILIKYGTLDDNVPLWHSREMAGLIELWNKQSFASKGLVKISEVPNKSHYWPEFMKESDVQGAIAARLDQSINPGYQMPAALDHFTLSVINPDDSGSKQGWKITQVEVPGRMARLEVVYQDGGRNVKVCTAHASQIQLDFDLARRDRVPIHIDIDGTIIAISEVTRSRKLILTKTGQCWSDAAVSNTRKARPMGSMIRFLSSSGPIYAVVPTDCAEKVTQHYYSVAIRFSTDAYLYGRFDTVILYDYQVSNQSGSNRWPTSNFLLLGGPTINTVSSIASTSQKLIKFLNDSSRFKIRNRTYAEGSTLLTLFPHPFVEDQGVGEEEKVPRPMALLVHGTDSLAIERGYSLLPMRTGTLLPEWIVVDKASLWKGHGGVVGAGWYDHDWDWSEAMSYLS